RGATTGFFPDPAQVRPSCEWRNGGGLADVDAPFRVEFCGDVNGDPREHVLVFLPEAANPQPAARDDEPVPPVDVESLVVEAAMWPGGKLSLPLAEVPWVREDKALHIHRVTANGKVLRGQPPDEWLVAEEGIPGLNRVPVDGEADPRLPVEEPVEHHAKV